MEPILNIIENNKYGIMRKYKDLTGQFIPEKLRHDPFYMFKLYVSDVASVPDTSNAYLEAKARIYELE